MKALVSLIGAACLAMTSAAQEATPSAPPAAAPPAAEAAPSAPAEAPSAAEAASKALRPVFVTVRIGVLEEPEAAREQRSTLDTLFDEIVRERVPVRLAGVRVGPDGEVLIRDPNLPFKRYGRITATDESGLSTQMRIGAVLENYDAVILEPSAPQKEKLPFLKFEPAAVKPGDKLLLAEPAFLEGALAFDVNEVYAGTVAVEAKEKLPDLLWWQAPSYNRTLADLAPAGAPVVLDERANPIGVALDNSLWRSADGSDSWIGARIMSDRRLTPEALEETSRKFISAAKSDVKEIEIQFRSDSRMGQALRGAEGRLTVYGLVLDKDGTIFIPTELDRYGVRQIEKITVADEPRVEAKFLGLYRDFGAMLVQANKVTGVPAVFAKDAPPPRGRVFYTLSVRRRFGQRQDEVQYNRYLDIAYGYKESRYLVPRKPMRAGDFILDAEGRMIGFCAPFRREERDEILARQSRQTYDRQLRTYLFKEIAEELKSPGESFDADARPVPRKEEARPVWLGVEFQPMNAALARALDAEGPTRGGARGLLVTDVYDPSPAARIGLKTGDILLSIGIAGMQGELDLAVPANANESRQQTDSRRLWRPRFNYLTDLLTRLGPRREIRLRLLHDKKEQAAAVTTERAPDDFDNADQFEDPSLGLTVRELTYEVRKVLRLPPDAPGVVVSEVQPGSKAAVAQIGQHEIITHVNKEPARTLKDFERLLRSAQAEGKVEFLVMNLSLVRLVEIDSAASAP